ncbi:hypothetical protein A6F49_09920 [Enteractinococcus helveticum]|uniref:Uncharacterized protein n=1 Tax=Enteractinococcus helveticum TaxID=1837282 RepID=A0A1B7LZ87_9MICC|nr:hypothetical protein A6F49_09920 [Enteractinococcus helveticum]
MIELLEQVISRVINQRLCFVVIERAARVHYLAIMGYMTTAHAAALAWVKAQRPHDLELSEYHARSKAR